MTNPAHTRWRFARAVATGALIIGTFTGLAGCSSADPEPVTAEATTSTQAPASDPTVELTYFSVNESTDVMRFAAEITNNADEAIVGMRTEWIAFDANDVIVGNRVKDQPTIPAGATLSYVGGAGGANLTGTPARVEVTLVDLGRFSADAESPFLEVSDISVTTSEFTGGYGDVTATATAPPEGVRKDDLSTSLIIRNAEGVITKAEFISDVLGPETFPGDSKFAVRFSLFNYEGPVDDVQIQVYIDKSL